MIFAVVTGLLWLLVGGGGREKRKDGKWLGGCCNRLGKDDGDLLYGGHETWSNSDVAPAITVYVHEVAPLIYRDLRKFLPRFKFLANG